MKIRIKKITSAILAAVILAAVFAAPSDTAFAKEKVDAAALMLVAANAKIAGINNIDMLKDMKHDYGRYYEGLTKNPDLDDEQRAAIQKIADDKIKAVEEKIEDVEKAIQRRRAARRPLRVLGRILGGGPRLVKGAVDVLGKGIKIAGRSVVRIIRNPQELLKTVALTLATGGTSSLKEAFVMVFKSQVRREIKKEVYVRIAKEAFKNPTLKKALRLKELLGVEGGPGLEEALEEYYKKQEEEKAAEGEDDDDGTALTEDTGEEVGPEGEGGYDDQEEDISGFYQSLENILNAQGGLQVSLKGSYTINSISLAPASADQITAYEKRNSASLTHLNAHIAATPGAVEYERAKAMAFAGGRENFENGAIAFTKDGADINTKLMIMLISDPVEGYERSADKRYTNMIKSGPNTHLEFISESLPLGVPLSLSYTDAEHPVPWGGQCQVTFSIDESGYIHVKGTVSVTGKISTVLEVKPYYEKDEFVMDQIWTGFGLYSATYTIDFVSDTPLPGN